MRSGGPGPDAPCKSFVELGAWGSIRDNDLSHKGESSVQNYSLPSVGRCGDCSSGANQNEGPKGLPEKADVHTRTRTPTDVFHNSKPKLIECRHPSLFSTTGRCWMSLHFLTPRSTAAPQLLKALHPCGALDCWQPCSEVTARF